MSLPLRAQHGGAMLHAACTRTLSPRISPLSPYPRLLRLHPRPHHASLHTTSWKGAKGDSDIPFVQSDGLTPLFPPKPETANEPAVTRGTITVSERHIFQDIFADIARRGLTHKGVKRGQLQENQPQTQSPSLPSPSSASSSSAFPSSDQAGLESVPAGMRARAQLSRQVALLRFPPSIRNAAIRAMDILTPPGTRDTRYTENINDPEVYADELRESAAAAAHWETASSSSLPYGEAIGESPDSSADPSSLAARKAAMVLEQAEAEQVRAVEQARIEGLMLAAQTDEELWQIMEDEVFSLPTRLGIRILTTEEALAQARAAGQKRLPRTKKQRRAYKQRLQDVAKAAKAAVRKGAMRGMDGKSEAAAADHVEYDDDDDEEDEEDGNEEREEDEGEEYDEEEEEEEEEEEKEEKDDEYGSGEDREAIQAHDESTEPSLIMLTHGPIYPSSLLLGLRLLDRNFARPSPLASAVLPRIKELGLESFVLGVSTPLYNEVLRIIWVRDGDIKRLLSTVEEMHHSGLGFDAETVAILTRANWEMRALRSAHISGAGMGPDALGGWGSKNFGEMVVKSMPEYEQDVTQELRAWTRRVEDLVDEKAVERGVKSAQGMVPDLWRKQVTRSGREETVPA